MNAGELCDELERIYDNGDYPALTVRRPWSSHNPTLVGELARPSALRWYLMREMERLTAAGAELSVDCARPRIALDDPKMFHRSDESNWDLKRKKLFLFPPERMELSLNRLSHYTGTEMQEGWVQRRLRRAWLIFP